MPKKKIQIFLNLMQVSYLNYALIPNDVKHEPYGVNISDTFEFTMFHQTNDLR